MFTRIRLPIALLLCGLTAACGLSGHYPSLAPRPEELGQTSPAPPKPATPPAADPALTAQLDRLLADARAGEAAFRAQLPATERAVASAGKAGLDSWAQAQQAVSRLEAKRAPTAAAASELDALARAKAEAAPSAAEADLGAINATSEQVRALVASQDQAIDRLNAALAAI
jgi:hypothetical protein